MKKGQFLLMKLAEECAEVSQRAIKSMQFGADQVQKGTEVKGGIAPPDKEAGLNNRQRLSAEIRDLLIMVSLAASAGEVEVGADIIFDDEVGFRNDKVAKIAKLNKYLSFSRQLGEIGGDWTI